MGWSLNRSHDAVIRVYDEADNVIETHEHAGEFRETADRLQNRFDCPDESQPVGNGLAIEIRVWRRLKQLSESELNFARCRVFAAAN